MADGRKKLDLHLLHRVDLLHNIFCDGMGKNVVNLAYVRKRVLSAGSFERHSAIRRNKTADTVASTNLPVVAHLAAQLPGWGDHELARRGQDLARRLTAAATPGERAGWAADVAALAGRTAFANALLAGLGEEGLRYLLEFLDHNALGPGCPSAW